MEPDARHYSASIMKLPILIAAHRLVERRAAATWTGRWRVRHEFESQQPGHRFSLDQEEDSDPATWAARRERRCACATWCTGW